MGWKEFPSFQPYLEWGGIPLPSSPILNGGNSPSFQPYLEWGNSPSFQPYLEWGNSPSYQPNIAYQSSRRARSFQPYDSPSFQPYKFLLKPLPPPALQVRAQGPLPRVPPLPPHRPPRPPGHLPTDLDDAQDSSSSCPPPRRSPRPRNPPALPSPARLYPPKSGMLLLADCCLLISCPAVLGSLQ